MKKAFWSMPFVLAIPLFAVSTQFWEVRTYDEFLAGKFRNLSLTSDGELILAPRFEMIFDSEQTLIWSAVADSKGYIYLGTGHDGKIYKVDPAGARTMVADLPELDVLALAIDSQDVLYAGTSPNGKVYRIESGASPTEFYDPNSKYIWALAYDKQGGLLVATGDKGVIYFVASDGTGEIFYETDETHVISMAIDKHGNVIAGGSPKRYVYRISPDRKAYVLYDSGMSEVHSVALASNGTIYVAVLNGDARFQPGSVALESAEETTATVSETNRQTASNTSVQSVLLEILPDGIVNTLWQSRDEFVYSVLPRGGTILFSTGDKGRIYSWEAPRKATLLLESTEEQTTRLIEFGNQVYAATANVGKLFRFGDEKATTGEYESTVKDTDAISSWGKLSWNAPHPQLVHMFTRTSNTRVPDKTWSNWSRVEADGASRSPKARFIQWKAVLKSRDGTAPVLGAVKTPYLQQNFRPEITGIDVLPPGVALQKVPITTNVPAVGTDPASERAAARAGLPRTPRLPPRRVPQKGARSFQWTATDKNQDTLRYELYYRGEAERDWRPLRKDLEDTFYTINSDTLPDGVYVLRVVASDDMSNPLDLALSGETRSRPFTIVNTPPTVTMTLEGTEGRRARIAIEASDATSRLNQAEVSVNAGEWMPVFPVDRILDSRSESFNYRTAELSSAEHVIAFRIYDENDNATTGKLVVRIR